MPFVCYSDEVEYVHRGDDRLRRGTDTGTLDLAFCCLLKSFDSCYLG